MPCGAVEMAVGQNVYESDLCHCQALSDLFLELAIWNDNAHTHDLQAPGEGGKEKPKTVSPLSSSVF